MPTVDVAGVSIHYTSQGQGSPVLFLMGLGVGGIGWQPQVEALRGRHRCITFDNRGVGASDSPPGPYTTAQMAKDALAVLDAAGETSAHVVGISLGGMIAQRLALAAPERVRSLSLLATHAGGPTSVPTARALAIFAQLSRRPPPSERFELIGQLLYPREWFETHRDELRRAMESTIFQTPSTPSGYLAQVAAAATHLTLHTLASLPPVPTLIATGADDIAVRPLNSDLMARALPHARSVRWAGVGHGCTVQARDAVNEELERLFEAA